MTTLYASPESVWARIIANTKITPTCWVWQGCINSRGYGCVGAGKKGKTALVHRVAVIVRDGSLDDELQVDHLCRNSLCVRPDHLDVVTAAENGRRGRAARGHHIDGYCGNGHLLTDETTYQHPRGQLVCRPCQRTYTKSSRTTLARQWALENGYPVSKHGRLPDAVLAAYDAASAA